MIVVVGSPMGRLADGVVLAAGTASRVALAAAAAGHTVQLVGRTGDDPTADALILDLVRGGVGHVALMRDPALMTPFEAPLEPDADADSPDADAEPLDATPGEGDGAGEAVGPTLDAADVDLGLRYLTDFAVVVLAETAGPGVVEVVGDAARWADASLLLVVASGGSVPGGLPPDAIVFEAPPTDPDGVFAALVGSFAAALDDGSEPVGAWRAALATGGWTESEDD